MDGASVTLAGPLNDSSALGRWTVATSGGGQFHFRNLAPGRYSVTVREDGYFIRTPVPGNADPGQVTVGSGRSVTSLNLSMIQGGTISGRILDPMGRPSPATSVTAARQLYRDGKPVLGTVKTATSNDRGEYRIFWLEPGEYVVSAERSLPGAGPARGYFPGSDDGRSAIAIRVSEGIDSARTDFSLGAIPASVAVSGTVMNQVAGLQDQPPAGAPSAAPGPATETRSPSAMTQFFLLPLDAPRQYEGIVEYANSVTSRDRLEGKFELRNVRSGAYDLFALVRDENSKYYLAHQTIEVGTQDLTAVVLTLKPGIDLSGTVTAGIGKPAPTVRIHLRPRLPLPNWQAVTVVSTDGSFKIPNVPEGQYFIGVEPADANSYVAELLQGRDSIVDRAVVTVLRGLADTLEILIQPSASTVRGTVVASPSKLADGVMITLIPEERRRENVALYKRVATVDGSFTFTGISPGKYRVFAWDRIPEGAELNPEFMDAYRESGTDVAVSSGSTSSVTVRLISK